MALFLLGYDPKVDFGNIFVQNSSIFLSQKFVYVEKKQ